MSIGPLSNIPTGLPASVAGAQRSGGDADQVKAGQSDQKFRVDQQRFADRGLGDELETDTSHGQVSDRDADGRLPHGPGGGPPAPPEAKTPEAAADAPPAPDALGELGKVIDLDA